MGLRDLVGDMEAAGSAETVKELVAQVPVGERVNDAVDDAIAVELALGDCVAVEDTVTLLLAVPLVLAVAVVALELHPSTVGATRGNHAAQGNMMSLLLLLVLLFPVTEPGVVRLSA